MSSDTKSPKVNTVQSKVMEQFSKQPLKLLSPHQVKLVDDALCCLGTCGEVRLVKSKGQLRFITVVKEEENI